MPPVATNASRLVSTAASERGFLPRETALILCTGFLGGLTTFSSFAFEGESLLSQRAFITAGLYLGGSIALGLVAVFVGVWLGRSLG